MTHASRITKYAKNHKVSLSLLLAVYGVVYLCSVVVAGWTMQDWGQDLTRYPLLIAPLLPPAWLNPIFFVTSIPALIVGTLGLCIYSIRGINPYVVDNKEHVAALLTASGFTSIVLGAWPLGNPVIFPWQWQKDIVSNGPVLAWLLYILGIFTLLIGAASLFVHSHNYRENPS